MKQSWFGISSCLAFLSQPALVLIAWLTVNALRPSKPSHMDMSGVAVLFAMIGFTLLIAITQIIGLAIGIVEFRTSAARIGMVLNGSGLLCTVVATILWLILNPNYRFF